MRPPAGAGGDGNSIHLIEGDVRFGKCRLEGGDHGVQVSAGSDFGDHAAEAHVLFHGGGDGVAEQLCTAHNADTGLITGGSMPDEGSRVLIVYLSVALSARSASSCSNGRMQ